MVGEIRYHKSLGKVEVLGKVSRSRTKVTVVCIEEGKKSTYTRHVSFDGEISHTWSKGSNNQSGFIDDVRKDTLSINPVI